MYSNLLFMCILLELILINIIGTLKYFKSFSTKFMSTVEIIIHQIRWRMIASRNSSYTAKQDRNRRALYQAFL